MTLAKTKLSECLREGHGEEEDEGTSRRTRRRECCMHCEDGKCDEGCSSVSRAKYRYCSVRVRCEPRRPLIGWDYDMIWVGSDGCESYMLAVRFNRGDRGVSRRCRFCMILVSAGIISASEEGNGQWRGCGWFRCFGSIATPKRRS